MHDYATMSAEELLAHAVEHHDLQKLPSEDLSHVISSVMKPTTPTPKVEKRGRPAYNDPTDPTQLPAIARRCQEHYMYVPAVNAYVKVTKKEFLRVVSQLTQPVVKAKVEQFQVSGKTISRLVVG